MPLLQEPPQSILLRLTESVLTERAFKVRRICPLQTPDCCQRFKLGSHVFNYREQVADPAFNALSVEVLPWGLFVIGHNLYTVREFGRYNALRSLEKSTALHVEQGVSWIVSAG